MWSTSSSKLRRSWIPDRHDGRSSWPTSNLNGCIDQEDITLWLMPWVGKKVITYITTLSEVISNFNEKIKQAAEQDAAYGKLKQQVKEGVIRRYWLEGDLLVAKWERWYVIAGGLRNELLRETHDAKWAGHPSEERTLTLLARSYYWPKMGEDV